MTQFIDNRKPNWHSSSELFNNYSRLSQQINRLMILKYLWEKSVGQKSRFWQLTAVQGGTLFVKVKISVAKNDLVGRRRELIKELNKHFEKPWIKHIEIQ